jgi:polar amino acid transport system permease protein
MSFNWEFFFDHLLTPHPDFVAGMWTTVLVSIIAMALALVVGVCVALLLRSDTALLRGIGAGYVWVIRGTPLLVQLVIVYSGLAAANIYRFSDTAIAGISISGVIQAAIVTLTIYESAYIAEIVRSGIESVDRGQFEASEALAMTPGLAMRTVILAQALRTMVPPLGNIFNGLMKETSILSIIGVTEMFLVTQGISATSFRTFEIFIVAALYYLLLTTVWAVIQLLLERRLSHYMGITPRPFGFTEAIRRRPANVNA